MAAWGLLSAAAAQGCAVLRPPPPPAAPPSYRSASLDELLRVLSPGEGGVATVQASYSARLRDRQKGAARSFSGMLAMGRPGSLRMRGSAAMLPNLFDLLVDGDRTALHVPRDNAVYEARGEAALLRHGLPDPRILTSLFVGRAATDGALHLLETLPSSYIVYEAATGRGKARLVRKVVFDRADLSPVRLEYFDDAGMLLRTVHCAGFFTPPGTTAAVPREVRIEEPSAGRSLTLRLTDLRVNTPLNPGIFSLESPPGARRLPLEELRT